jgi:DNA-binding GntR family transcriptional regulator
MPKARKDRRQDCKVDRTSYEPPFRQVSRALERQIASGDVRVGERMPSEAEICEEFGVSRMTARRAFAVLVESGLVRVQHGRGYYVEPMGLARAQFSLDGLRELFSSDDLEVRVVAADLVVADDRVSGELQVAAGDQVIHLRRQILHKLAPIVVHEAYLIDEPGLGLLDAERSVGYLRGLLDEGTDDSAYRSGIVELQIDDLDVETAELLGRPPGASAWVLEHTFYDVSGKTLSWGRFVVPRELLRFPARVGIDSKSVSRSRR